MLVFTSDGRAINDMSTTKEKVIKAINDLPDDAEFEDAMERLLLLAKVERGIQQADSGGTFSHDEVKRRVSKWLI